MKEGQYVAVQFSQAMKGRSRRLRVPCPVGDRLELEVIGEITGAWKIKKLKP